jgi:tetratricopeptide (TPR) repeat protein
MKPLQSLKLAALVLLATAIAVPDAEAQRQRREKVETPAPLYPDATRVAPEGKYTQRLQRQVNNLIEAYNAETPDANAVVAAANELIAQERATPYDKGMAQLLAGSAMQADGQDEQAIAYFSQVIEGNALSNDNHYGAMLNMAAAYTNLERYDEANAVLTRLISETNTKNPKAYTLLGNNYYNSDKFEEAVAPLQRALELEKGTDEREPALPQMLMAVYTELGRAGEAVAVGEELYNQDKTDKRALVNLALMYTNAEMPDKAVALLDNARATGMFTDAADYQRLVAAYYNVDRQAEAAAVLEEGINKQILPGDAKNYLQLAQFHYFSENIPAAVDAARKGAAVSSDGEISLFLAQVLDQEDRNAETKAAAKEAIAKGLKNPGDAWMVLARAEFYSDNIPGAQAAYREAMKDPKTRDQAQKALAQISR